MSEVRSPKIGQDPPAPTNFGSIDGSDAFSCLLQNIFSWMPAVTTPHLPERYSACAEDPIAYTPIPTPSFLFNSLCARHPSPSGPAGSLSLPSRQPTWPLFPTSSASNPISTEDKKQEEKLEDIGRSMGDILHKPKRSSACPSFSISALTDEPN
ncbi:unnamed protein product [Dibothriocephalus latus]|uniref:Uncharacterized protein n=1 Tax=Dibothriocephalus latus TaxID=60516 RepID=A0A3P7NXA6_DIBLA|nr:unnamed protein product [Dibothriocephalus latus]